MTVLCFGGAGYIGLSVVARILSTTDQRVVIFDDFSNSRRTYAQAVRSLYPSRLSIVEGDALNIGAVRAAFKHYRPSGVLHFAGHKSVSESMEHPSLYLVDNLKMTENILTALSESEVSTFVFSSSASIYSERSVAPYSETSEIDPKTPYGESKALSEEVIFSHAKTTGSCTFICLRYFNPVGAARLGDVLLGDHGKKDSALPLFPALTTAGLDRQSPVFQVFGLDYNTRDGSCVRDFIDVEDLAIAHVEAMRVGTLPSNFEVFNLGTGTGTTVLEIASVFQKEFSALGLSLAVLGAERRSGDLEAGYACIRKAEAGLGWKPMKSLADSVNSEIEFRIGVTKALKK